MNKLIKEYQINIPGSQNGVPIPSGFRVAITAGMIKRKIDDTGFDLWIEVCSFLDGNHGQLLKNDDIPNNNYTIDIGATLPASGIKTLVNNNFDSVIDAIYDSGNWVEI